MRGEKRSNDGSGDDGVGIGGGEGSGSDEDIDDGVQKIYQHRFYKKWGNKYWLQVEYFSSDKLDWGPVEGVVADAWEVLVSYLREGGKRDKKFFRTCLRHLRKIHAEDGDVMRAVDELEGSSVSVRQEVPPKDGREAKDRPDEQGGCGSDDHGLNNLVSEGNSGYCCVGQLMHGWMCSVCGCSMVPDGKSVQGVRFRPSQSQPAMHCGRRCGFVFCNGCYGRKLLDSDAGTGRKKSGRVRTG